MEIDAAIEKIGFGQYQIKTMIVFFILQVADGCEVLLLAFLGTLLSCEWRIDSFMIAALTTTVFIGMFFGALILGNLSDRYGRKPILFIASFVVLYSSVHSAFAPNFNWMCLLRGGVGFGIAGFLVINSSLIAEISPRSYRASCQAIIFTGWGVGSVLIVGIGAFVVPWLGWRMFLITAGIPVLIGSIGLLYVDESPRYFITSGDHEAALLVIKKMAAQNKKELPCEKLYYCDKRGKENANIATIFKSELFSTLLLMSSLAFVAGFTYYGAVLLSVQLHLVHYDCLTGRSHWPKQAVYDDSCCPQLTKKSFISMAISAAGDLFSGIAMTFLIDCFGRKKGMAICLILSAILFILPTFCLPRHVQDVVLLCLRCLTLTFIQCTFVYMVEIFPTTIRSTAIGVCSLAKRVGGMITPFVGQMLVRTHMKTSLSLYTFSCILCTILLILFGEETSEYRMFENVDQFADRPTKSKKNYGSNTQKTKKKATVLKKY